MKERPILFSAPMVRAILEGRKTQTRRVVKPVGRDDCFVLHDYGNGWWPYRIGDGESAVRSCGNENTMACPYGQPGDRLWVRETFALEHQVERDQLPPHGDGRPVTQCPHRDIWIQPHYRATDPTPELHYEDMSMNCEPECRWKPSIHMPRWASRILLEVVSVRVERLRDISEADAKAEGSRPYPFMATMVGCGTIPNYNRIGFRDLWMQINGIESWNSNPWVWVVEFRRIDQ